MNSRSSVNETNLVNLCGPAGDLSTLNQLDSKDGLISFPFDHIYACHSESPERRHTLQLDKEVEISTHCVVTEDKDLVGVGPLSVSERDAYENQIQKLKALLISHLDLIQQQNDYIIKKDKAYQALEQERDALKNRLTRRITLGHRTGLNTSSLLQLPPPQPAQPVQAHPRGQTHTNVSSTVVKSEPSSSSQEPVEPSNATNSVLDRYIKIMLNSFSDLLIPDNRSNPFLFESDINDTKPFGQETFALPRPPQDSHSDVTRYLPPDLSSSSLLDNNLNNDNFTMIESKPSFIKKEISPDTRPEPMYTVTSNSGNTIIQRIRRRRTSTGIGCLSRMPKSPGKKAETAESKMLDSFSVNKKSKMINTYGKCKNVNTKRTSQFTGSLSDRLQLIDTTPTGEDPYQLGEADMREQSPIPKLMLQKTNHGRMKVSKDSSGETTVTSRRIYDTDETVTGNTKGSSKTKLDRFNLLDPFPSLIPKESIKKEPTKTLIVEEPDLDIVKTETEIDWRIYSPSKAGNETSLCDFSYGENADNLASQILPGVDLPTFFAESPLPIDSLASLEFSNNEKTTSEKSKKRAARTTSLIGPNLPGPETLDGKRGTESKRGRKRALSTTGLGKGGKRENPQKGAASKPKLVKGKAACRGKKSPLPGMVTNKPYHTSMGDPDLSWYLGLDPHLKLEDVDPPADTKASTVEVPRWREKPYTSTYTLEGTENLDDKVFEKRHQKLEAEERRQLRWHMRRVREQRHVERLRQRQRDSGSASPAQHAVYTVWPQPQRDVRFIEITDTLPVTAFGEDLPAIPDSDFVLPWVRTSKAQKRSKRSKTHH